MTLASRYTGIDERQLDVSRRGQSRQKIEVLEHEPDPTLANPAQLIVIQSPDLTTAEQIVARRGPIRQPIMFISRFARTGRPHQRHAFTRIDPRIDPIQHV